MKKRLLIFISSLSLIFLINIITGVKRLILISPAQIPNDISLYISPWYYIFFPFIGIPWELNLTDFFKQEGLSFILIILFISLLISIYKKENIKKLIQRILYNIWIFLFLLAIALFFPLPPIHPISKNYKMIDLHSHTYFSHDGLYPPIENIKWHIRNGYSLFAITEHWNTDSCRITEEEIKVRKLNIDFICGKEVSNKKGYFNELYPQNKEKVLISVEWWKRLRTSLNDTIAMPIDAIEVFSTGFPFISMAQISKIYRKATISDKIPLSTSDWHGWSYISRAWTAFYLSKNSIERLKKTLIKSFFNKEKDKFIPLILARQKISKPSVFIGFQRIYWFLRGIGLKEYISILIWGILISIAFSKMRLKISNVLNYTIFVFYFILTTKLGYIYYISPPQNKILKDLFLGFLFLLFIALIQVLPKKLLQDFLNKQDKHKARN